MFYIAYFIGIFSYLIFFLGIVGLLYRDVVVAVTILFWSVVVFIFRKKLLYQFIFFTKIKPLLKSKKIVVLFVILLALQALINFIGVLGPELAFDALWYHLTLPKLWLSTHSITFIPGGLLYYSAMPKLAETLYTVGLSFGNEITAKFIHFLFGLLTCLALFKLSRKFLSPFFSLLAVIIFYANLVVAWESITAYVDLVRAFFEVMGLWAFINWYETRRKKWFVWSAIMIGLAITTKVLAIGSVLVFSILYLIVSIKNNNIRHGFIGLLIYWLITFLVPLPWFVFSYLHTGNPVYPFFTNTYHIAPEPLSLFGFFNEVWTVFMKSSDPISPLYLMLLPIGIWLAYKYRQRLKNSTMIIIGLYSLVAIIVWYFTPRTGGGRFLLPYLPALSVLCSACIAHLMQQKKMVYVGKVLLGVVILISCISLGYRFVANAKYVPVIVGKETKAEFLSEHLTFSFGDFYDVDGYFARTIKSSDRVLLYGFHNLYYVDFPFVDSSWVQPGDIFTHIAVQNGELPLQYQDWQLVYENPQTMVKLYKQPERIYSIR